MKPLQRYDHIQAHTSRLNDIHLVSFSSVCTNHTDESFSRLAQVLVESPT